ncbi:uncharacterized protein LOC119672872 [Teleopsis dalmanni]|uniref:uncharacterized protein LOC119672872 n=1 Tax=Teleopsis dalmanni TaxID=139649 RepID=UPI0018CD95C7|nr:uncharacterized protein LOC119672872 [Teleopsis dalmanni]
MKLFVVACLVAFVAFTAAETAVNDAAIDVAAEPSREYLAPVEDNADLAKDGYRYKTVRRLKYRHRRDVSQEYLPPLETPSQEYLPPVEPETKVAEDGYRYKTVRRLKFRRHRREADASEVAAAEAPANEYLPPAEAPAEEAPVEQKSAELGADGYRYKTVRRIRYRYRH